MVHKLIGSFLVFISINTFGFSPFKAKSVYKTQSLEIIQISLSSYVHISFLQTDSFGLVPCNGMLVIDKNECAVFDTPTSDEVSLELINFIENTKKAKIVAVVINHFHDDCLGGINAFHSKNILSIANSETIKLAKINGTKIPKEGFENEKKLKVGTKVVINKFFGEAHTSDNIVSYLKKERVLFGGCMVKELNATKGYLGNATIESWPQTIKNLKKHFRKIELVIPGHGQFGGTELLNYTIELFSKK